MAVASIALITSGTKELGSPLTISTNRASSSYTHTITYSWAGRTGTIGTGIGASTTWTPSLVNMAPYLTNRTSATCTLTCTTYEGSTLIGTTTSTFTLSIPASVKPTISSLSITDDKGFLNTYGGFVSGMSIMHVAINASGIYGSTISKYTVKIGSHTSTDTQTGSWSIPVYSDIPSGSQIVTISAIDSRSRGQYEYKTITIHPYTRPSLDGTTIKRWNTSTNQEDEESSTIRIRVNSVICDVGNKNLNRTTITIKYRLAGGSWTTYTTRKNQGINASFNVDIPNLSENNTYEFQITSIDSLGGETTFGNNASSASPVIDLKSDGNGIGLLAVSEQDGVTLGGDIYFSGTATKTNVYKERNGTYSKYLTLDYFSGDTENPFGNRLTVNGPIDAKGSVSLSAGANVNIDSGYLICGSYPVAGYDSSNNTVGLYWGTSKSLGGYVRRTLWSGSWSYNTTITVSNNMRYNLFIITLNDERTKILAIRENKDGTSSRISGFGGVASGDGYGQWTMACYIQAVSSTRWRYVSSVPLMHFASNHPDGVDVMGYHSGVGSWPTITKIEGLI